MKIRVCYTVEVSDELRRALNARLGLPGKANRDQLKTHYRLHGLSIDDDVMAESDVRQEQGGGDEQG